jgi:hypothetical protein
LNNQRPQRYRDGGDIVKKDNRSWLTLVSFFLATTLASSLVFAVVFAGVTAAIGDEPAQAADETQVDPIVPSQTFSGVITDARCGAKHTNSRLNASECVKTCVRNGSRYTMVDGDRKYELKGELRPIDELAGQRVTLTGILDGGTIRVMSANLRAEVGRARP